MIVHILKKCADQAMLLGNYDVKDLLPGGEHDLKKMAVIKGLGDGRKHMLGEHLKIGTAVTDLIKSNIWDDRNVRVSSYHLKMFNF